MDLEEVSEGFPEAECSDVRTDLAACDIVCKFPLLRIAAAKDPIDGVRDLLWAMLSTREFMVNH